MHRETYFMYKYTSCITQILINTLCSSDGHYAIAENTLINILSQTPLNYNSYMTGLKPDIMTCK